MTININEISAVTKQMIIEDVPDALETAHPVIKWLTTDGRETFDGGTLIQFPVKMLANQSYGAISGTNAIVDVTPSQQDVYGTLNLKYAYFSANFTQQDYALNSGENAVINLIKQKTEGAKADMVRYLSTQVHGTSSSNALLWEGLKDITAATGTAYAGLLDTDYTNGSVASAVPYLPVTTTDTTLNYTNITKMMYQVRARMQISGNNYKRVFGIMNPASYSKYLSSIQGQQLAVNTSDMYFSGFDGFKINGIEFYMDAYCPGSQDGTTNDNYVYLIPMDVLKLYVRWGATLGAKESPFDTEVQLPNSPIKSVQNYIAANMVCNNRRLIAVNKTFVA
jgi:hypothetical protein